MREKSPDPDANRSRRAATRVTVLTEMDEWSASTRYRALQHVPRLRDLLGSVDVSMPDDTIHRLPGRIGQMRYFSTHAAHYARRQSQLPRIVENSDALFIQRGLYALGPGTIVRALDRFSGRVVFDLDDAVFQLSPSRAQKGSIARWLYGPQQALRLMRRADAIVVSTTALAEMLPPGLATATVMPTVPDPGQFRIAEHSEKLPIVVGWAGTVGGITYLNPLAEIFRRLADEGLARLMVVSSHPWSGCSTFRRWTLAEETSVFERFSVGIMPLPDTGYTRAKAGFKLLQYMAAGIPVVSSAIGVNRELVERSRAGFLAESPADWYQALHTLATDADLRRSMGARGRVFVERHANLDEQAQTLARLLTG
jgi:glycosyltransferase involved in cell wall biosynthesis